MLNLRVTLTSLASRAWAYISASSSFSGKFAEPMVMVEESDEPEPPALVGSPPHALSGRIAATTAAIAMSLVFLGMGGTFRLAASGRCRRWGLAEVRPWRNGCAPVLRGRGRRGRRRSARRRRRAGRAATASTATSRAPAKTRSYSLTLSPSMSSRPRPPRPTYAAMVAVAHTCSVALRRPLMISGSAIGTSARNSTCIGRMPIPTAASTADRSTDRMPAYVAARIGGTASTHQRDQHRAACRSRSA